MTRAGGVVAGLLLFVAGVLVGANAVYFWMNRSAVDPAAALVFERDRSQHGEPERPPARATGQSAEEAVPGVDKRPLPSTVPRSPWPEDRPAGQPKTAGAGGGAQGTAVSGGLIVPVRGVTRADLEDTFNDARGSDRSHQALDIMATRGTPVLAAVDGHIEKLFDSVPGGLTIYQFDRAGRHAYYYAHLDRYAAGLEEGDAVQQGEVIGYVGSTGNANDEAPHLHFAIFVLGPEKRWWEGTAVNPYPLLTEPPAP